MVVDHHVDDHRCTDEQQRLGAMIAGIVVTFVLGVVLMSLVFLSSRRGYDKPPDQVEKPDGSDTSKEQDRE